MLNAASSSFNYVCDKGANLAQAGLNACLNVSFCRRTVEKLETVKNQIADDAVFKTLSQPVSNFYEGHKRTINDVGVCGAAYVVSAVSSPLALLVGVGGLYIVEKRDQQEQKECIEAEGVKLAASLFGEGGVELNNSIKVLEQELKIRNIEPDLGSSIKKDLTALHFQFLKDNLFQDASLSKTALSGTAQDERQGATAAETIESAESEATEAERKETTAADRGEAQPSPASLVSSSSVEDISEFFKALFTEQRNRMLESIAEKKKVE